MNKQLLSTITGVALIFGVSTAQGAGELFFYNWTDYTPEDMLQKFEKDTGIKVTMDTYDSNETLLAKLKSGATGYDLAVPSSNFVSIMISEDLLQKVDVKSMPNYKNVDPGWQGPAWDPDQMYSSPYQFGTTSFAIRTDAGLSCDSLKTFFEPEGEACGNLSVFQTPEEVASMAALYLGQKYCDDSSASLKEMVLADMGIAWLAGELIKQELAAHKIVSYAAELGEIELDTVLYYRDGELAAKVGEVIAGMDGLQ